VPSPAPDGERAPRDGLLPASAASLADERKLGLYIHVPFCAVRCGYCDFNTYTAQELDGVSQASYPAQAMAEMTFAKRALDDSGVLPRALSTVFLGGGTPTLLGPEPLAAMLQHARDTFGFEGDAEVTVEANPDSVSAQDFQALASAGVTRVSLGVQSSDPLVLANPGSHPRPETGALCCSVGERCGHPGLDRPHLWNTGGDPGELASHAAERS
jgi:coproporphyrinogen III oxidase-like Fe-S oxidoreductase